jgi:hypothetical protein
MAYRDVILADNPVAYYRLGEASGTTAADERAFQAGTYVNAPILAQPGALAGDANTAVAFDGTTQRVDVGDLKISAQTDATVELWFKATDGGTNRWMFSESSTLTDTPLFGVILEAGKVRVLWRNDANGVVNLYSPAATYNDAQWHHVVATKVGTALRLYVDGGEVVTGTTPGGAISLNTSTIAAVRRAAVSLWYAGTLDEVAVYNYALTAAKVAEHYQAGTTAPVAPATFVSDTFTDAAGTLLENHVGETGATWAKHPSSGTNTVSISAQGRLVASGSGAIYLTSGVPAGADYDAVWDVVVAGTAGGNSQRVCVRMDGTANTNYGVDALPNGDIQLTKRVAGSLTQIGYRAAGFAPTVGLTYRFECQVRGTSLRILVNGVEKIAVTDASITAAGRVGLYSSGVLSEPGLHIDNLAASDAVTADTVPPVTTISVPPNTAISNKPGFDTFDVTITADEPFVEYELRRVPTDGATRTEGTLIETATVAATTSLTTTITYAELSGVEGPNKIKGWTRDAAGNWSGTGPTPPPTGTTVFTEPFFGGLSTKWNLVQRVATDRITVVTLAGAADGQAGRFEVRYGDHVNGETNSRAELGWTTDMASQGEELTYSWRTMFATDYPSANTWQVFLQWKNEGTGTPPLGLSVKGEQIHMDTGPQFNYKKLWTTPLVRGQWLDFLVRVYWSETTTGWVEATYNGQQVLARTYLPTLYSGLKNYLKMGLYRDAAIQGTGIVYHDALKVVQH